MSSFTWLDYSEHERRKMLDVVDHFRERDTRDELGLGSIRDSFADQLFPGTSTIMTRARYFLLVAWTYQRLENKQVSSTQIAGRARRAETELIEVIENSDDHEGNIGRFAKTTLKRLPSSVYWQGLGVWGIRTFAGSQSQYHRSLDRHYLLTGRHGRRTQERDEEHDDLASSNWHSGLLKVPADFPERCSLSLSRAEAEYLAERIRLSPLCAGSLLSELVARWRSGGSVEFAWEHPDAGKLPAKLRELLLHARNFSEVMHGAALLYNLILAEQAKWKDGIAAYREALGTWTTTLTARARAFSEWDRQRFWEITRTGNPRISAGAHAFVTAWIDLALAGDAARIHRSRTAWTLIRDREKRLKRSLARIDNPRAQELWNGDSGSGQLEFRWRISQRLLTDIFVGMEAKDA
jgi:hypothetical protein